ncbi:MAG: LPS assembly protein LptD, partial [Phycisphaerales bacterium]|nr:LPS assembly protein LptD [Phycisphaerales bacterium]
PSSAQPPVGEGRDEGDAFSGREFEGIDISDNVQLGDIMLRAARAAVWQEGDTQRVLLSGDVQVKLGVYEFSAARATVWLEELGVTEHDENISVYQVAVFFDRVSDPVGEAGISQHGDRLLATGLLGGNVSMRADVLTLGRADDGFLIESEHRLARFLTRLTEPETTVEEPTAVAHSDTTGEGGIAPGMSRPYEPDSALSRAAPSALPPAQRLPAIFARRGLVTISAGEPTLVRGDEENAVIVTGGVVVAYTDTRGGQNLQISAERAVMFLAPGPLTDMFRSSADAVRGIYLEGDAVATDGRYTLRGPRMYYDMQENQAYVVDAVFSTYDERRGIPLYVRARTLKQEASNKFTATGARLATSAFFEPHFAVGASTITVTRTAAGEGGNRRPGTYIEAEDLTMRGAGVPFFYWPSFSGDVENIPLKEISASNSSGDGFALKTTWDFFGLTGLEPPEGLGANLLLDMYFDRGFAAGTELNWGNDDSFGEALIYGIFNDQGTDRLTSGAELEQDGDTRGVLLGEHRWRLDEQWTMSFEGAYISDEAFIDSFFERDAESRREFTNAAYLKYLDGNAAFSMLAKGAVNDFTPNEYLLQSQGYTVNKLPEIGYFRIADDLFPTDWPGLLTYSSEYRASRLALNMNEPLVREFGFDTPTRSLAAFGLPPDQSLEEALRLRGLSEEDVLRFDTRHELAMTADWGPVRINPFLVGRFTAYDSSFEEFTPDNDESMRYWAAAGTRFSTSLQHVDDSVDSRLLDLHRIRHILEPNMTVWASGANIDQNDLPVYDERVESLADGAAVKLGLDQTWQTKRGGEGQWRNVDVFKLRTDLVYSSADADLESPIRRFYDFRPEYSKLGDHASADGAWQVTDAFGLTGMTIYDFEISQPAMTAIGGTIQHDPDFTTFGELRYINARDITLVNFGATYQLTRKYSLGADFSYDTDEGSFQGVGGHVRRRFPDGTVVVSVRHDEIAEDTTIGVMFEPVALRTQGVDLNRLRRPR